MYSNSLRFQDCGAAASAVRRRALTGWNYQNDLQSFESPAFAHVEQIIALIVFACFIIIVVLRCGPRNHTMVPKLG